VEGMAPKMASEPPNLRDADDVGMSCGACRHYQGRCTKFDYDCAAEQVCDSFEAGEDEAD